MKVLILKDEAAYLRVEKNKLWNSFLAGYWSNGEFVVVKDRYNGSYNSKYKFKPFELVSYIEEMQNFFTKDVLF